MAEALDVNTLKRRSRRRLVGAVALVLLAVIVLPMVFDTEPRQTAPPVSVRIPSEDAATFSPQLAPPPPNAAVMLRAPSARPVVPEAPAAGTPAPSSAKPTPKPESATARPKPTAPAKRAEAKPATQGERTDRARAEAALKDAAFVVPVAALANADKVKQLTARLAAAKMPYYTESIATAQGTVTRVRAGPFADRAAAEKALEKLKGMGLKPGKVFERS
jgi:DedD protein